MVTFLVRPEAQEAPPKVATSVVFPETPGAWPPAQLAVSDQLLVVPPPVQQLVAAKAEDGFNTKKAEKISKGKRIAKIKGLLRERERDDHICFAFCWS